MPSLPQHCTYFSSAGIATFKGRRTTTTTKRKKKKTVKIDELFVSTTEICQASNIKVDLLLQVVYALRKR